MTCEELREKLILLVSHAANEAEQRQAEAHARTCDGCRRELTETQRVMALLDRAPAPAPPSSEVLARARAPIFVELDGLVVSKLVSARDVRWLLRSLPLGVAAVWIVFVTMMSTGRARASSWMESLVVALAATLFAVTAS